MRDIFSAQPSRRFGSWLPPFSAPRCNYGSLTGAYSSDTFDILSISLHECISASSVMRAYPVMARMNRPGLLKHIQSVANANAKTGEDLILQLEASPLVVQRSIVSRGTFCYRTTDQEHFVKFPGAMQNIRYRQTCRSLKRGGVAAKNGRKPLSPTHLSSRNSPYTSRFSVVFSRSWSVPRLQLSKTSTITSTPPL